MKYLVKIKRDGTLEFLGGPPPGMKLPGAAVRKRFSEIIPVNPVLRVLFRVLRLVFGEWGHPMTEFTRRWPCQWEAIILRGNIRGTRRRGDRKSLMEWERQVWRNN